MVYSHNELIRLVETAVENDDIERLDRLAKELFEEFKKGDIGPQPFSAAVKMKPKQRHELIGRGGERASEAEESALALNFANFIERARRRVRFNRKRRSDPDAPIIVSEGDSWFQYPFILEDVIDVLSKDYAILSLGAGGDTVRDMVRSGEYLDAIAEVSPVCFLFSGGGNDLVGDGKLGPMLKQFTGQSDPSDLIDDSAFNPIFDEVIAGYENLLKSLNAEFPGLPVLSHAYDHPFNIKEGPWIWPFMEDKGIPVEMARKIVGEMLDRFGRALADLDQKNPDFKFVGVKGSVSKSVNSWHDALHPKNKGFKSVAEIFNATIREVRLTAGVERRSSRLDEVAEAIIPINQSCARAIRSSTRLAASREDFSANEAIIKSFALSNFDYPQWSDFGPEEGWRKFKDPNVRIHIKDVIALLEERLVPESLERVENRLKTRPDFAGRRLDELDLAVDDDAAVEAIIGGSDLEPIQSLLEGYKTAKAVGLVQVMSNFHIHVGSGTGFLVAPGLFLTNHHVLPSEDLASRSYVVFDDEISLRGARAERQRFSITRDIYFGSEELDFAFVSVEPVNRRGKELSTYGFLPLIRPSGKAIKREPVSIIQHPGGDPKMIAIRNSLIMGRVREGIYYTADTQAGSSGSPCVNREWQVVALHHRTVPHPTRKGEFLANRGIRISSICDFAFQQQLAGSTEAAKVLVLISPPTDTSAHRLTHEETDIDASQRQFHELADSETIDDGAYAGCSEAEFLEAIGRDSDASNAVSCEEDFRERLPIDSESVLARIGERGRKFIIAHEVSSRRNYDRKLQNPILPGARSGITIGIGYDLGHQSRTEFRRHWGDLLSAGELSRLEACIGKTQGAARRLLPTVRNITIPYEDAVTVFERASLPKYFGMLNRHIDDAVLAGLHPHCVAVLVSLTFNRGASYGKSGERYREMRAIKDDLNSGKAHRIDNVPGHIRDMKRIWRGQPNVRGLLRRRDEEAALFADGLRLSNGVQPPSPTDDADGNGSSSRDGGRRTPRSGDDIDVLGSFEAVAERPGSDEDELDLLTEHYSRPDGDEQSELDDLLDIEEDVLERSAEPLSNSDVRWVRNFALNPDYAHLPEEADGRTFTLTPSIIDKAIALGSYDPYFTDDGDLIVGIRGAKIASGRDSVLDEDEIALAECKPDHRRFRCTMVIYSQRRGVISAFQASSVPNRGAVVSQYNKHAGLGGVNANMLPTGCYELCVGTHNGSISVPTVLRLGTGPTPSKALRVTTLRTINDGTYGTKDFWDNCRPMDNIHPAFSARSADFSSLGCLTIPGRYRRGEHTGIWGKFRRRGGFDHRSAKGDRYNLLLTTGMELAAIADAAARNDHAALSALRRLAHGSQGQTVSAVQQALGITDDGRFGPGTKKALAKAEQDASDGKATGIYSMVSEQVLGFGVFS